MSDDGRNTLEIPGQITVRDLADALQISPIDVIKKLMANGVMANINQLIDYDTAAILAGEFGFERDAPGLRRGEGSGRRWRSAGVAESD